MGVSAIRSSIHQPRPRASFARAWQQLGVAVAFVLCAMPAGAAAAFGLDDVATLAKDLAAKPYKAPADRLPQELRDLDYDALRDIRFKP
jgi:glucans biosynthesis protein